MKDPKEEAGELIEKLKHLGISHWEAKQSALIAVEFSIKELTNNWEPHEMFRNRSDVSWAEKRIKHQESVKEEINKL